MIAPPVLAELRRPAVLYDAHYAAKYRHPLRKLTTFALLEGPATALRKSRSKLAEQRIERAQELVLAGLRGSRRPLLGVTRDLGGALTFDPVLVFAVREGLAEPARVALPQAVQLLLEAYLPVPACPLAPQLRDAILSANPWLEPATAEDMAGLVAAAPVGGAASLSSAQMTGRRVYLVGCGGYVREQVLPHFRGLVAGAVDYKAALILRHAAPGFPIWSDRGRLLDELSREESPLVIVSSYHSDHAADALATLEANPGAHVFIEKPPVTSVQEARALAERRAAGAWIDVGYNRRYAPLLLRLLRELPEGSRPWLLSMRVRELRLPESHWYHWPNQGTRVTGNLCHWLDLAVHLLGTTIREVSVTVGSAGVGLDVAFEDGSLATISSTDRGDDLEGVSERIELFADDRTLVLDDFRRLTVILDGRRRRAGGPGRQKGHGPMYASLRDRWQNGGAPLYSERDLVAVAQLVETASGLFAAGGGPRTPGFGSMSGRTLSGRTLARNSLLNILGMALPLLAALAAVPALSRGLGAARLGVLSLAWAVLGLFAEFGVGRATTKFVAEVLGAGERKRLAPIVWTTVAGQLAVGLALGVAIAVATPVLVGSALKVPPTLVGEARTSFLVIAAAIPAILLASCFRGVLEAAQRFDLVNAIRVPTTLANYLLPLVGVALGWRLPGVMLLLLAARLASVAAFWLAGWVIFPELRVRPRLDGGELRRVLSFGGWSTVSSIASPVLIYVDRFILAALAGMTAVAYYAVPFELVNRLLIIPGAVAATLFPAFSAVSGRSLAETDALASRGLKYILCLLGPLLVIIAAGAHDLLALWIGSEYAQAGAMALRLLAVGVAVNALAHVPHALLMGRGRPDIPAKLQLLELPVQLAVAWVLVSRYGVAGAAGAWLFRVALDAVLLFLAARHLSVLSPGLLRHARLPQTGVLLAVAAIAAGAAAAGAASLPWRLSLVAIGTLAAAGTVWRLGLNQADRAEVLRFLRLTSA